MEPESSWILVRFITAEPQRELHVTFFEVVLDLRSTPSFSVSQLCPPLTHCSGQPLRTPPMILASWFSHLRVFPSHIVSKLAYVTRKI